MRVVIQRVTSASVSVEGKVCGAVGKGLLVFLGIENEDTLGDVEWLSAKIVALRVFEDADGKMNVPITQIDGNILLISQFTLFGSVQKGTRPSFNRSAPPAVAIPLYNAMQSALSTLIGKTVPTGIFGAMMDISAVHDGPVTLILDTKRKDF